MSLISPLSLELGSVVSGIVRARSDLNFNERAQAWFQHVGNVRVWWIFDFEEQVDLHNKKLLKPRNSENLGMLLLKFLKIKV